MPNTSTWSLALKDILEKSLEGMSYQDIYQKSRAHLLTQKKKSADFFCRYRTTDGLMCAVGCFIPDELYDPGIEGRTVSKEWSLDTVSPWCLLRDLQCIHDANSPDTWPAELDELAAKWLTSYGIDLKKEQAEAE